MHRLPPMDAVHLAYSGTVSMRSEQRVVTPTRLPRARLPILEQSFRAIHLSSETDVRIIAGMGSDVVDDYD